MLFLEILIFIVVVAFMANGYRAGGVETLGRVLGSILGFVIARKFAGALVGVLAFFIPPTWAYLISFIVIFLLVGYLIGTLFSLAGKLLKIFTRLPIVKQINNIAGLFLGFIEAVIVLGGTSWLLQQSSGVAAQSFTDLIVVKFLSAIFSNVILRLL